MFDVLTCFNCPCYAWSWSWIDMTVVDAITANGNGAWTIWNCDEVQSAESFYPCAVKVTEVCCSKNLKTFIVFSCCYLHNLGATDSDDCRRRRRTNLTLWGETLWRGEGVAFRGHCWSSFLASSQCQSQFDHCKILSDLDLLYWNLKHPNNFETSKCLDNGFWATFAAKWT